MEAGYALADSPAQVEVQDAQAAKLQKLQEQVKQERERTRENLRKLMKEREEATKARAEREEAIQARDALERVGEEMKQELSDTLLQADSLADSLASVMDEGRHGKQIAQVGLCLPKAKARANAPATR